MLPGADGPRLPPDRNAILRQAGAQALSVLGNLTPGSWFSGRVIGPSGADTFQVQVRGTTITVASPVPLDTDAVLQFVLVGGGRNGEPVQVRLADGPLGTPAGPTLAQRLAALGLPATPDAVAVLTAFEDNGAPLVPARLRHAVAVLESAHASPPDEPVADDAAPRDAAPSRRPVTPSPLGLPPATTKPLALSQTLTPALPSADPDTAAPPRVPRPGVTAPPVTSPRMASPLPSQGSTASPATVPRDTTSRLVPTVPVDPAVPSLPEDAPPPHPATARGTPPPDRQIAASPRTPGTPAPPILRDPARGGVVPAPPRTITPTPSAAADLFPAEPDPTAEPDPVTDQPARGAPPARAAGPSLPVPPADRSPTPVVRPLAVAPSLAADPRLPTVFALLAKADLPVTPTTIALALRAASDRLPDAATAVQAWDPALPLPDVADDDPPAALRAVVTALSLAGLRAIDQDPAPALLTTVAQTIATQEPAPLASAALRELAADPLLPPRKLDDYDHVLAFPLLAQGQAAPARLAVSTRVAAGGQKATWVRVDAELSRLGPLSVRLSGADHGPIAITVVAQPAAARLIAAGLPDLLHDLHARGLPAAVRVVEEDSPW